MVPLDRLVDGGRRRHGDRLVVGESERSGSGFVEDCVREIAVVVCQKFVGETFCVRTVQRTHDLRKKFVAEDWSFCGKGRAEGRGI